MTKIICYQINDKAPKLVPGRSERAWMDATNQRYAYRCLPLTIANAMGWEMLSPIGITAEWNGGPELTDITVAGLDGADPKGYALSHFGHGVLTFQTAYLFRTEPGIALWARGAPNLPKDGIFPLDGIIETDWLNFTFTMNWIFTRPGKVTFEKDEPICFITPMPYHGLDSVVPEIVPIAEAPEIKAAYDEHSKLRLDFNARLAEREPEAVKLAWQKWYFRGQHPTGEIGNPDHLSKVRAAKPRKKQKKDA